MDNAKTCRFGFIHVIEQGDTLYKLGKRYGVTVSALLFANPWVNVYNLQIGDEICVPVSDSAVFLKKSKTDAKRQKGKIWIRKERMKCRAFHNLKCL